MAGVVLAIGPSVANALALGDIEVRSALGQPLDARVPIVAQPGERFEAACFYISNVAALPSGVKLAMTLERSARGAALRIRSEVPVEVPAAAIQLAIACPGRQAEGGREYAVLLDPPGQVRAPSVPVTVAATLLARPDDSLTGIARKVFPQDSNARALYLQALMDANPALAAAGDAQPIAAGTAVALPDLRDFAAGRKSRSPAPTRLAAAPAVAQSPAPRAAPALPKPEPLAARPSQRRATEPQPKPPAPAAPAKAALPDAPSKSAAAPAQAPLPAPRASTAPKSPPKAAVARATEGPFVLRLSSPEMDLTRSRGIDEPMRSRLRERMLILDADDQVAALLSMRNNLRQLESRVSELQLKLAQMPTAFPDSRAVTAKPTPAAPSPIATAPAAPAKVAASPPPANAPAPAAQATPPAPVAATPAPVAAPQPSPAAPSASSTPPPAGTPATAPPTLAPATSSPQGGPETKPAPTAAPPKPAPAAPSKPLAEPATRVAGGPMSSDEDAKLKTWGAIALALLLLLALALWLWRRRQAESLDDEGTDERLPAVAPAAAEPRLDEVGEIAAPVAFPAAVDDGRRTISSDADLPTRLRDTDSGDLRRRYIDERFPEVASGAIRLDDPDSIVKGARLSYEDGALPRAVELLQFAIEQRPEEPRTWLALFEIFRLERLAGEFSELARRFREQHGESNAWHKVQFFGREIDPANPLYRLETVNTLETIGPREAHKVAAAAATFDPIAENWLNAPMDFENEVLANELRKALMTQAGLTEQDLAPNPTPALRSVEMFTVA